MTGYKVQGGRLLITQDLGLFLVLTKRDKFLCFRFVDSIINILPILEIQIFSQKETVLKQIFSLKKLKLLSMAR